MVRDVDAAADILAGTGDELSAAMEQTAASAIQIATHTKRAQDLASAQNEGAQKSTKNVRNIALRADEVRSLVEREAACVIESSASIEEMLANIRAVTKNIEHMSREYRELIGSSDSGSEKLDALVSEVKGISERSKKLEEANKLISGIAAKTNLLAMNAAIEAAHAGDAGAGFAVVADEIRQLAESVAKQSKVIAMDVREISVSIVAVSLTASGAHGAFKGMAQEIQNLSNLAEEIRNAMLEQNEGSTQILEALGEIQNVSMETRTAANAMDEASDLVLAEMDRLTTSSADIDRSMTEVSQGINEVSSAVTQVTSLALRNRDGITIVREKMGRFTV
jgi:methyl-accepting chemotaxis protein